MSTPFKLKKKKDFDFGNSPIEKDEIEFTHGKKQEEKHFLTKQKSIPEVDVDISKSLKEANAKKLTQLEQKFKAGKITQKEFERKRDELPTYTDY